VEKRDVVTITTLDFLVVGCGLLMFEVGIVVAEAIAGLTSLLLGLALAVYSARLLWLSGHRSRHLLWTDELFLCVTMLTGLLPVSFFGWMCFVRFTM